VLPFTCAYCGKKYCVEHRLPEIHNCSGIPKAPPSHLAPTIPEKENQEIEPPDRDEPAVKKMQNINSNYDPPHKLGLCPKCHSMSDNILAYSARTISFRCNRCGVEFSQLKETPNEYCEVVDNQKPVREVKHEGRTRAIKPESMIQKRLWTRKVTGLAITLIIVLSAAYFLSNYLFSPIPSPATSPIAITGRVVGVVAGSVIGENVSGVEISVIDSKGNEVMTNKTNATGCFSFSNLLHGSYTIQITVPYGYVAKSATSYLVTYSRNVEFRLQNLLVNPKTMHYKYTLRGVSSEIAFTVYEGMYDYLVSMENSTVSYVGQEPSPEEIDRIVTLRYVNEGIEKDELSNLVGAIERITPNEDDQVRIAISLV
jgi:hypothetical protein